MAATSNSLNKKLQRKISVKEKRNSVVIKVKHALRIFYPDQSPACYHFKKPVEEGVKTRLLPQLALLNGPDFKKNLDLPSDFAVEWKIFESKSGGIIASLEVAFEHELMVQRIVESLYQIHDKYQKEKTEILGPKYSKKQGGGWIVIIPHFEKLSFQDVRLAILLLKNFYLLQNYQAGITVTAMGYRWADRETVEIVKKIEQTNIPVLGKKTQSDEKTLCKTATKEAAAKSLPVVKKGVFNNEVGFSRYILSSRNDATEEMLNVCRASSIPFIRYAVVENVPFLHELTHRDAQTFLAKGLDKNSMYILKMHPSDATILHQFLREINIHGPKDLHLQLVKEGGKAIASAAIPLDHIKVMQECVNSIKKPSLIFIDGNNKMSFIIFDCSSQEQRIRILKAIAAAWNKRVTAQPSNGATSSATSINNKEAESPEKAKPVLHAFPSHVAPNQSSIASHPQPTTNSSTKKKRKKKKKK